MMRRPLSRFLSALVTDVTAIAGVTVTIIALLAAPPPITFTDVTAQAGIHFVHNAGRAGKRYLPETLGAGCAFFDADKSPRPTPTCATNPRSTS